MCCLFNCTAVPDPIRAMTVLTIALVVRSLCAAIDDLKLGIIPVFTFDKAEVSDFQMAARPVPHKVEVKSISGKRKN